MGISRTCTTAVVLGAALAASAFVLPSTGANAATIQDGTFNGTPPTAANQYYLDYGNGSPNGGLGATIDGVWNVYDNTVDVVAPGPTPYGMTPPPGVACCSVDLVGYGSTGGLDQQFTTLLGQNYLTFYYANNFFSTNSSSPPTAVVEVGTGGAGTADLLAAQTLTHGNSSSSNMNWTLVTYSFVTLAPETAYLSFDTTYGYNSGGIMISDVSISSSASLATPLPSTWTMLFAGFVGLGFFAYRGSNKKAAALAAA
jgi:hypothetical protein